MIYVIAHYQNGSKVLHVNVSSKKAMVNELRKYVSDSPGPVSVAKIWDTKKATYVSVAWRDWSRKKLTWA